MVTISSDGLKAFLLVPPTYYKSYPTAEQLRTLLGERRVVYGIDDFAIQNMVDTRIFNKQVLVAEGTLAEPGVPACLEMLVDLSSCGKPKEMEDGSVDHKDLQKLLNVKAGQELIRRIPPIPGKNGRTVTGKIIPPPKDDDVKIYVGKGTKISEKDKNLLVAEFDGALISYGNNMLEVSQSKVINGDVDYSTGNVSFAGDVYVKGSVRAGFNIQVNGDITIAGNVEDCQIECLGNIDVLGGAFGADTGHIKCGGYLKIQNIEHFKVTSGGDVIVSENIIHSTVKASGIVIAKSIVGGTISASAGISVETSGAASEPETVLDAGGIFRFLEKKKEYLRQVADVTATLSECKENMYITVKENMDSNGVLLAEDEKLLNILKEKRDKLQKEYDELINNVEEIDREIDGKQDVTIEIRQAMPNTIIQFWSLSKKITTKINNVVFSVENNKIKVIKK